MKHSDMLDAAPSSGDVLQCASPAGEGSTHPPAGAHVHTIVVATAQPVERAWFVRVLTRQGYKVFAVTDGREALERVRRVHCDILITAMEMPNMDGLELLRALRDAAARPAVIAVSGGSGPIDTVYKKSATLLGAELALSQPLHEVDLVAAIRTVLRGR